MTIVTIRQPGYFPYIGFFKKIQSSDVFVYLDDAQYAIRAWDNRNKIRVNDDISWISVPVIHPFGKKLNEVEISYSKNWIEDHINLIEVSYKNAPYFNNYWSDIELILKKKWKMLVDLNLAIIEYCNKILDIKTKTKKSSELNTETLQTQRLFDICKQVNATEYQSGIMGKEYLDKSIFEKGGIKVSFENFIHPTYNQGINQFIPNLAIIDLLFYEGENAKKIIESSANRVS